MTSSTTAQFNAATAILTACNWAYESRVVVDANITDVPNPHENIATSINQFTVHLPSLRPRTYRQQPAPHSPT
mgnify:CR=1 FL=1